MRLISLAIVLGNLTTTLFNGIRAIPNINSTAEMNSSGSHAFMVQKSRFNTAEEDKLISQLKDNTEKFHLKLRFTDEHTQFKTFPPVKRSDTFSHTHPIRNASINDIAKMSKSENKTVKTISPTLFPTKISQHSWLYLSEPDNITNFNIITPGLNKNYPLLHKPILTNVSLLTTMSNLTATPDKINPIRNLKQLQEEYVPTLQKIDNFTTSNDLIDCDYDDYFYDYTCDDGILAETSNELDYYSGILNVTVANSENETNFGNASERNELSELTLKDIGLTSSDLFVSNPKKWNPKQDFIDTLIEKIPFIVLCFFLGIVAGGILFILNELISKLCYAVLKYVRKSLPKTSESVNEIASSIINKSGKFNEMPNDDEANSSKIIQSKDNANRDVHTEK